MRRVCCPWTTDPWSLQFLIFFEQLHVVGHRFWIKRIVTFFDEDLLVFLIAFPFLTQSSSVIFRIGAFQLIDDFLSSEVNTIFYLRMELVSALLSLSFKPRKVSLFEGIVLGMMLIVLLIGSVSIFNILVNKFWFCLDISLSTTESMHHLHLWYLFWRLDKENVGFHGVSILMPGLIFLRLLTCFW